MTQLDQGEIASWIFLPRRRRVLHGVAIALCFATPVQRLPAQTSSNGLRLGVAAVVSRPVLSGDAKKFWSPVGSFGNGIGGQAMVDYDWSSFGVALSLEASTASVGPRSGGMFGVALLGSWLPPIRIGDSWQPRATLGYVREGMLMSDVMPSDVNSSATRIPSLASRSRSVGITGNGARLGLNLEHSLDQQGVPERITLVTGIDVDIVGFDTITDDTGTGDTEDISLNRTSWSAIPHLRVGILFHM